MKRFYVGLAALVLLAVATFATEKAHNAYKTHRIDANTLLLSCEDEHQPVVKKFENTTLVMITCQTSEVPVAAFGHK